VANRRMVSSDIFEDDFFISLTMFERMVWIGLVVRCADDQGRLQDRSVLIKSQVFPADMVSPGEIDLALEKFREAGKIERYKSGDKSLVQILNWWKYQTPQWAMKSKYPAPAGWVDREKYHGVGGKVCNLNWDNKGGYQVATNPPSKRSSNPPSNIPPSGINDVKGNDEVKGEDEGDDELKDELEEEDEADSENEDKGTPQAAAWGGFSGPATIQEARDVQARIRMETSKMCRVTPMLETEIARIIYENPEKEITDSIHIAIRNGKPTWAYAMGVLKRKAETDAASVKRSDYIDAVER
jgi:hypothetical protein